MWQFIFCNAFLFPQTGACLTHLDWAPLRQTRNPPALWLRVNMIHRVQPEPSPHFALSLLWLAPARESLLGEDEAITIHALNWFGVHALAVQMKALLWYFHPSLHFGALKLFSEWKFIPRWSSSMAPRADADERLLWLQSQGSPRTTVARAW